MTADISTVPEALDRIVALARAVLPSEGDGKVQVLDGGPVRDFGDNGVAIGYTPNFGDEVVTDTRTVEQMAADPHTERYDITNLSWSWYGSKTDQKAVRDQAYAQIDAIAAELAKDQTLGMLVMRAFVSSTNLAQEQTNKGAAATVRFVISVVAQARAF